MENNEKLYNIYYGENEKDYVTRYLKESDIIDGYLTEAKAFEIFYTDMIMSNNYLQNNFDDLQTIVSGYDEENDYCVDEYQVFIINIDYDEWTTARATEKMGNTFYFDNKNEVYLTGVTDLGMSRRIVPTDLKVIEAKEDK